MIRNMRFAFITSVRNPKRPPTVKQRHRGLVSVYLALGMLTFLGICALVVDMGFRYYKRAEAQKAADAAALAGAWWIPDATGATTAARYYAAQNGYTNGDAMGTQVVVTYPANMGSGNDGSLFRVDVVRSEPFFFGGLLRPGSNKVGATAIAKLVQRVELNTKGGGTYGTFGIVNLAVFGPDAYYEYGDSYSTKKTFVGSPGSGSRQDNPLYNDDGYDFNVSLPSLSSYQTKWGTTQMQVEVYDPDCYNVGNAINADGRTKVDEMRTPTGGNATGYETTTQYQLVWETYDNPPVRTVLGSKSWGKDATTDQKWIQDPAFKIDLSTLDTTKGRLVMNVKSTAGASENGFDLRAGPPHSTSMTEATWSSTYAGKAETVGITARSAMPMNFNTSGIVTMTLGEVPSAGAGGTLKISKFDTDVGATSITYTCSSLPGQTFTGRLSTNAQFEIDSIPLPSNYTTGTWYATYNAGNQDTSVWEMSISGGKPSQVYLVK